MEKYLGIKFVEAKSMSRGEDDGYLVRYPDGYESWCPKEQFELANRKIDALTFGHAIEAAKQGKKIARKGWNGKGMFVFLVGGCKVSGGVGSTLMGGNFESCAHFCRRDAQGKCVVGWLASQTDMLAEDWVIVV